MEEHRGFLFEGLRASFDLSSSSSKPILTVLHPHEFVLKATIFACTCYRHRQKERSTFTRSIIEIKVLLQVLVSVFTLVIVVDTKRTNPLAPYTLDLAKPPFSQRPYRPWKFNFSDVPVVDFQPATPFVPFGAVQGEMGRRATLTLRYDLCEKKVRLMSSVASHCHFLCWRIGGLAVTAEIRKFCWGWIMWRYKVHRLALRFG